jgi:hypothetical protein
MRATNIVDREYMRGELSGASGMARVFVLGARFGVLIRHVGLLHLSRIRTVASLIFRGRRAGPTDIGAR